MKKWLLAGMILILPGLALAQTGDRWLFPFDSKTIETVQGIVVDVWEFKPGGIPEIVHLNLVTKHEKLIVALGPNWFMTQQNWKITDLDHLEITGSRINLHGKPAIIAQVVKKGDQVMIFRNETGRPIWVPSERKIQ